MVALCLIGAHVRRANNMQVDRGIVPGTLLVSSPGITSEYFRETVVIITERQDHGHWGYILNKKTIAEVRTAIHQHDMEWPDQDFMFEAGPVNRQSMVMLHTPEWYSSNTMQVGPHCAISSDKFMFEKMISGATPVNRKFLFGQSVWVDGQLEREINTHKSWLTCTATYSIIWDDGHDQWKRAIDLCARTTMSQYI